MVELTATPGDEASDVGPLAEEEFEPKPAQLDGDEPCPSQAPPWMATFSDLGTLLMAFFVLILSILFPFQAFSESVTVLTTSIPTNL